MCKFEKSRHELRKSTYKAVHINDNDFSFGRFRLIKNKEVNNLQVDDEKTSNGNT